MYVKVKRRRDGVVVKFKRRRGGVAADMRVEKVPNKVFLKLFNDFSESICNLS